MKKQVVEYTLRDLLDMELARLGLLPVRDKPEEKREPEKAPEGQKTIRGEA